MDDRQRIILSSPSPLTRPILGQLQRRAWCFPPMDKPLCPSCPSGETFSQTEAPVIYRPYTTPNPNECLSGASHPDEGTLYVFSPEDMGYDSWIQMQKPTFFFKETNGSVVLSCGFLQDGLLAYRRHGTAMSRARLDGKAVEYYDSLSRSGGTSE